MECYLFKVLNSLSMKMWFSSSMFVCRFRCRRATVKVKNHWEERELKRWLFLCIYVQLIYEIHVKLESSVYKTINNKIIFFLHLQKSTSPAGVSPRSAEGNGLSSSPVPRRNPSRDGPSPPSSPHPQPRSPAVCRSPTQVQSPVRLTHWYVRVMVSRFK